MGIRISLSLVLGIDDLQYEKYDITDPRWAAEEDWHKKPFILPPRRSPVIETADTLTDVTEKVSTWEDDDKNAFYLFISVENMLHRILDDEGKYDKDLLKSKITLGRLVYHHMEYGMPNILGVEIDRLPYAANTLYALAAIYPEFQQAGYKTLPSIPLEEDTSEPALIIRFSDKPEYRERVQWKRELIENNQNHLYFSTDMGFWCPAALHILRDQVGLQIERKDLKLMLCWRWS